jgi:acylphosphatase
MSESIEFHVFGHVQGVFYRVSTQAKAKELELTGWVNNKQDGSVHVLACGSADKLVTFEAWLWKGPAQASVINVEAHSVKCQEYYQTFEVVR